MKAIFKNWGNTKRFLTVLLASFILLILALKFTLTSVFENEFDIKYTTEKTLITIKDGKFVIATSVLAASDYWTNTGIEIRPGETCTIKISGKIHTSCDKMINSAQNDSLPFFPWCDASGIRFQVRDDYHHHADSIRKTLLLDPNRNIGAVLLYLQKDPYKIPNCKLAGDHYLPPSDSILNYDMKKGVEITNDTKTVWLLWASVNDILIRNFDSECEKLAYFGGVTTSKKKKYQKKITNWKSIKSNKYNTLWFDDNIGNFIISAKIEKEQSFFLLW